MAGPSEWPIRQMVSVGLHDRKTPYGAVLDAERVYRYLLWRVIDEKDPFKKVLVFIGVNPSTADEYKNDPTINIMMKYGKSIGAGLFLALNLFAFRATQPRVMRKAEDPEGPRQEHWYRRVFTEFPGAVVVAAWGNHGTHLNQNRRVLRWLWDLGVETKCFKTTRSGHPHHPLYIDTKTVQPYYGYQFALPWEEQHPDRYERLQARLQRIGG